MDPVTIAIMVAVASAGIYQSYQTKEMTEDQLKMESERVELEATQESVARYEALNAALASQIAAAGATGGISGSAGDNSVTATLDGSLLAGDYIQLGSANTSTLHKVLVDRSGSGTMEIWPALRENKSSESATLTNTVGKFRLSGNSVTRPSDSQGFYSINFSAMEAV